MSIALFKRGFERMVTFCLEQEYVSNTLFKRGFERN